MTVLLKFALAAAITVLYAAALVAHFQSEPGATDRSPGPQAAFGALLVNTVIPETEYSGLRHADRLAARITSAMAPYIAFPIG